MSYKALQERTFTPHKELDSSLILGSKDDALYVVGGDLGNDKVAVDSPFGINEMPHSFRPLTASESAVIESDNPFVYTVNGAQYRVGEYASREGAFAVQLGTMRYKTTYLGTLWAINLFEAFPDVDEADIHLHTNVPPKYLSYRAIIQDALEKTFHVSHKGKRKTFHVKSVTVYPEPQGGLMNMLINSRGLQSTSKVWDGRWLHLDIGGFTTDATKVFNGKADTTPMTGSDSMEYGMRDVLKQFERLARHNNAAKFMAIQGEHPYLWREAFASGIFDSGNYGKIDVKGERDRTAKEAVVKILQWVEGNMGGLVGSKGVSLSGGGGSPEALGQWLEKELNIPIEYAGDKRLLESGQLSRATMLGAVKGARILIQTKTIVKK